MEDLEEFIADRALSVGVENSVIYDRREEGYRLEKRPEMKFAEPGSIAVSKILLDSRALLKTEMMGLPDKLIENCISQDKRKIESELIANERFHYVEPHHGTAFLDKMWEIGKAIRECRVIEAEFDKTKDPFPTI